MALYYPDFVRLDNDFGRFRIGRKYCQPYTWEYFLDFECKAYSVIIEQPEIYQALVKIFLVAKFNGFLSRLGGKNFSFGKAR